MSDDRGNEGNVVGIAILGMIIIITIVAIAAACLTPWIR